MIIKPYSQLKTEGFVAADFPAVRHFFPCNDVAGSEKLIDAVRPGDSVKFGGLTRSSDGYGVESDVILAQGSSPWRLSGARPFFVFAVASFSNAGTNDIGLGSIDTDGINMEGTAPNITLAETPYAATPYTLVSASTIYGRTFGFAAYNSASGIVTHEASLTAKSSPAAASNVGLTTSPALTTNAATGFILAGANTVLYGLLVMEFETALPTDLATATAWMTKEWARGNKAIYPAWRGRS